MPHKRIYAAYTKDMEVEWGLLVKETNWRGRGKEKGGYDRKPIN